MSSASPPESVASSPPSSFRSSIRPPSLLLEGRHVLRNRTSSPFAKANVCTYVAITIAALGALMFGINQSVFGIVQQQQSFYDAWCKPYFSHTFNCLPDQHGNSPSGWKTFRTWSTSLPMLGGVFGCIFLGPVISYRFGRRPCISLGGFICFAGSLFASYFTFSNSKVFLIGRFVMGFGTSLCCFAVPLYNSEVAPPEMRGLMGSVFQFMVVLGGVLAATSVAVTSIDDWRFGVFLPGIPGVVVSVAIWFTPESPRFVMENHDFHEGLAQLQRLRVGDADNEAFSIRNEAEMASQSGPVSYKDMFTQPGLRLRMFIACYLQIGQQLTCVNAFLSYTSNVFEAGGISDVALHGSQGRMYVVYLNLAMLIGCVLGAILIDSPYGGRRRQLLASTVTMGPALIVAGIAILLKWPHWIPLVMFFVWCISFQHAWGIVPWVYPSETFSMNERDRAVSVAICVKFLANFVINFVTLPLLDWNAGLTLLGFGALNLSNTFFVCRCIRETQGVPLEETPALFDGFLETIDEDDEVNDIELSADNAHVSGSERILNLISNLYMEVFFEIASLLLAALVLMEGICVLGSYQHMTTKTDSEDAFALFCLFYCTCIFGSMACCVRRRPWLRWRYCAYCWDGPIADSDELGDTVMYATVAWLRIAASVIFIIGHIQLSLADIVKQSSALLSAIHAAAPVICGVYTLFLFIVAVLQLIFVRPSPEERSSTQQSSAHSRTRRRVKLQATFPVRQCIICAARPANVMLRPCRHAATCEECLMATESDGVLKCSVCRNVVHDYDVGIQQGVGYKTTYVTSSAGSMTSTATSR